VEHSFSFGRRDQDQQGNDLCDSAQSAGGSASESICDFLAAQLQALRQQRAKEGVADSDCGTDQLDR
jgi:hypothetical protein